MSRRTRADCTVRALVAVAGIPYELADLIAAVAGRKAGQGFWPRILMAECARRGVKFRKLRIKRRRTLERFEREYPAGKFYVVKRGHAFAVIDGKANERQPAGALIYQAWQFVGVTSGALIPAPPVKPPRKPALRVDRRPERAARVDQAIDRWERRLKRAERALRKLRRQRSYYARVLNRVPQSDTVH